MYIAVFIPWFFLLINGEFTFNSFLNVSYFWIFSHFIDTFTRIAIFTCVNFYKTPNWVKSQEFVWTGKFCGKVHNIQFDIQNISSLHIIIFISWILW